MIQWMEEGKSRVSYARKALLFLPNLKVWVVKSGRWAHTLKWGSAVVKRRNSMWWAHKANTRSARPAHIGNRQFTYSQLSESTRTKGRADTTTRSVQQSALLRSKSTTSLAESDTLNRKQRMGAVRDATTDEDRVRARHRDKPQTIIKGKGTQGEESQSLACLEAAEATPPQSRHLNSAPHHCKL